MKEDDNNSQNESINTLDEILKNIEVLEDLEEEEEEEFGDDVNEEENFYHSSEYPDVFDENLSGNLVRESNKRRKSYGVSNDEAKIEANARREQILDSKTKARESKINEAGSNLPKSTPGISSIGDALNVANMAKDIKENPEEASKEILKDQVKKIAVEKVKTAAVTFISENPYVLAIIAAILCLFFLVILVCVYSSDSSNSNNTVGLNGYAYVDPENTCETYTIIDHDGGYNYGFTLEDAVAVILVTEMGGQADSTETLKAFAIAIRSNIVSISKDCIIQGNESQVSYYTTDYETGMDEDGIFQQVVNETKGLVIYDEGKISGGYFSAFCLKEKTDDYYVIYYGANVWVSGSEASSYTGEMYEQSIPIDFIDNSSITKSWLSEYCTNSHPLGMSAWGAYYLALEENYTSEELIAYYYGDDSSIVSIYKSAVYSGNYENYTSITSEVGEASEANQITTTLSYELGGDSAVADYNVYIYETVVEAGVGTRAGVVAAVIAFVGNLYESYNLRVPYIWGGGHVSTPIYGLNPTWGSGSGLDCSGFVFWALANGGFVAYSALAEDQRNYGTNCSLYSSNCVGIPGDLLYTTGHILMIIGTDYENDLIYVAEASNSDDGIRIRTISTSAYSTDYYVVDMSCYYGETDCDSSASVEENYCEKYFTYSTPTISGAVEEYCS